MKYMFLSVILSLCFVSCGSRTAGATNASPVPDPVTQAEGSVEFAPMVHDFGDISTEDGPVSCSFTMKNTGDTPVAIYEVVSSCGCTGVTWTREPIQAGKSGTINATYKNEDGPNSFDKTLTVYVSGVKKPVILRLRGVVHEKKKSLAEIYGGDSKIGNFGLKTLEYKVPTLRQGLTVSETAQVANLGRKPMQVDFTNVSEQLSVSVSPNPIPAGTVATMTMSVTSDSKLYGRNTYRATPVIDGKASGKEISVKAFTQENFASLSDDERKAAPLPMFKESTFNFGTVKKGTAVKGEFIVTNKGETALHFFKADPEYDALIPALPADIPAGRDGKMTFILDTGSLPEGENVVMISLTTNSPMRPVVNLFVAGQLK